MMKIIKVIVDELPEGCRLCQFRLYDTIYRMHICNLTGQEIDDLIVEKQTRPEWCPLMTHKRLLHLWRYAETGDWESEE